MFIIVRLSGGLGNQIFQLNAALYAASASPNACIVLDNRFLSNYESARDFEIQFILANLSNTSIYSNPTGLPAWASRMRFGKLFDRSIGKFAFLSSTVQLRRLKVSSYKWLVLDGYFQSPEFSMPRIQLLELFERLSQKYFYLRNNLSLNFHVPLSSIHIRRGDYVSSKSASSVFKAISLNYYRAAVRSFGADVMFLVFGDDPLITSQFAKEVGGIDIATLGLALSEEFMLMALCDHHIIANSTFSWWASYLGYVPGKRVIAPKDWYIDANRSRLNPLLLPHFELISSD
jgi:hypothetical protein